MRVLSHVHKYSRVPVCEGSGYPCEYSECPDGVLRVGRARSPHAALGAAGGLPGTFLDVTFMSTPEAAAAVNKLNLHVLIDVNGHTQCAA